MDTEKIKVIMKMFEESQISKMDLQDGDLKLTLEKENIQPTMMNVQKQEEEKEIENEGTSIKSPLVGTFYQSHAQGQPPFVEVGSIVNEGDTLCIIEAMKVMNEIKADMSGKVLAIHVADGETVEYDQTLMVIG